MKRHIRRGLGRFEPGCLMGRLGLKTARRLVDLETAWNDDQAHLRRVVMDAYCCVLLDWTLLASLR